MATAKKNYPEKFTMATMVQYIAEKHELTKAQAKDIVEDLFDVMEKGVMTGHRVPFGQFGKIFVHVKPARKARMGRNPATGEEMKIPAKKATKVPKVTFSRAFKDGVLKAKMQKK